MVLFALGVFGIIYIVVAVAGIVVLLWLAITAIRALNVHIAKNRVRSLGDDPIHGARL